MESEADEQTPTCSEWDLSAQSYEESLDQVMLQNARPTLSDACDLLLQACEETGRWAMRS
jgi:hypothetical protein